MNETLILKALVRLLAGCVVLECKVRFLIWSRLPHSDPKADPLKRVHGSLDTMSDSLADRIRRTAGILPKVYTDFFEMSSIQAEISLAGIEDVEIDLKQLDCDARFLLVLAESEADLETNTLLQTVREKIAKAIGIVSSLDKA